MKDWLIDCFMGKFVVNFLFFKVGGVVEYMGESIGLEIKFVQE